MIPRRKNEGLLKRMQALEKLCEPETFTQVPNMIFSAVLLFPFTDRQRRIVLAVCRMTYGWPGREGGLAYSWISKLTDIDRAHVAVEMRNLGQACVLRVRGQRRCGAALDWVLQEDFTCWDVEMLERLRSSGQRAVDSVKPPIRPGAKVAPTPSAKMAHSTQCQSGSPLNICKHVPANKTDAAEAAVPLDNRKEDGETEPRRGARREVESQLRRIGDLRESLRRAGLNLDVWIARKARTGVPADLVAEVLDDALAQKDKIRDVWPWAEEVLHRKLIDRKMTFLEQKEGKRETGDLTSIGGILAQVARRAERAENDWPKSGSGPLPE